MVQNKGILEDILVLLNWIFFNQGKYLTEKLCVITEDFSMQDYFCVTGATNHSATFPQKACWQK